MPRPRGWRLDDVGDHAGDVVLPGGGAMVEVARSQPGGGWRWVIDQSAMLS
ncbi:MAG TPA: hypothetical protein VIY52_27625 [Streptosporangiaceae bacterium]